MFFLEMWTELYLRLKPRPANEWPGCLKCGECEAAINKGYRREQIGEEGSMGCSLSLVSPLLLTPPNIRPSFGSTNMLTNR